MSSSAHIDNKKKDILVLGIGPTQGLEHTLTAEKMYSINFTVTKKEFCLSLHYNRANSHLFVNGTGIYKFGNCSSSIMSRKHFKRLVSVDYDATDFDDIVDIHKYLMKK